MEYWSEMDFIYQKNNGRLRFSKIFVIIICTDVCPRFLQISKMKCITTMFNPFLSR